MRIDDCIGHFGVVGQISELNFTEQAYGIAVKNRSVEDLGELFNVGFEAYFAHNTT